MTPTEPLPLKKREGRTGKLDVATHRRILAFLNDAVRSEDLMYEKVPPPNPEADHHDDDHHEGHSEKPKLKRKRYLDSQAAKRVLELRDQEYPLGFRHVDELGNRRILGDEHWDVLRFNFSSLFYGSWSVFPQLIPRRGPGGNDGVVHAALLHTGKVLFITADETTLLWNPNDTTSDTFEDPVNQPHLTPNATDGYSVLCGGHSFLSDGRLLVVGGGGYGPHSKAKWGYKFDATTKRWSRTGGSMVHDRWYPTVLTLGDRRIGSSREVLIVCGHGGGDMEIYDETTDSFRQVSGDTKPFPNLYPGLHLLPNSRVFYTRTGWASAGADSSEPRDYVGSGDDQSANFSLTGASTGIWTDIAPVTPSMPDRTKGMSVMLLSNTAPHVRILVVGGLDPTTNNTYEIVDVTSPSTTTSWSPAAPFPDGENRSLASAVLLPDGSVLVCGGIQRNNSPCAIFYPQTNTWSAMAALPSIRDYHSVALLLPSGQVAVAGWNNTSIEIFDPPYLFRGARPVISTAEDPLVVNHGENFVIESSDAPSIVKVVLVRPMAVTHQTDTEQKVLELPYVHDHANPTRLTLTAPDGGTPHSLAQQGYYMIFAVNNDGVPSVAKWVYLKDPRPAEDSRCASLRIEIQEAEDEISGLQELLHMATPSQKGDIMRMIRLWQSNLRRARQEARRLGCGAG
jgi:hypothetical protein